MTNVDSKYSEPSQTPPPIFKVWINNHLVAATQLRNIITLKIRGVGGGGGALFPFCVKDVGHNCQRRKDNDLSQVPYKATLKIDS